MPKIPPGLLLPLDVSVNGFFFPKNVRNLFSIIVNKRTKSMRHVCMQELLGTQK